MISHNPTPSTLSNRIATAPMRIGIHHRPPAASAAGHSVDGSIGSPTGTRARPDHTNAGSSTAGNAVVSSPLAANGSVSSSPGCWGAGVASSAGSGVGRSARSSSCAICSSMAGRGARLDPKSARCGRRGSRGGPGAATLPGMIGRGWIKTIATATGVAAATGAAQLGLGYGLGVINWLPGTRDVLPNDAWVSGLTWAVWISATSVISGAVVADQLSRPSTDGPGQPTRGFTALLWRLVLSIAAAIGALVAVALIAVPARAVELADASTPPVVAAGYAVLGLLVGVVLAALALTARAVATNLVAAFALLWGFALVAVTDRVMADTDETRVPLGFWDFTAAEPWFRNILLPDAAPVLVAFLVIGALAALPAARRGDGPIGVATSGIAGPLLFATAHLLTQPSLVGVEPLELSRHLVVPYAVLAGLAGSVLAALARPRTGRIAASPIDTASPTDATAGSPPPMAPQPPPPPPSTAETTQAPTATADPSPPAPVPKPRRTKARARSARNVEKTGDEPTAESTLG